MPGDHAGEVAGSALWKTFEASLELGPCPACQSP